MIGEEWLDKAESAAVRLVACCRAARDGLHMDDDAPRRVDDAPSVSSVPSGKLGTLLVVPSAATAFAPEGDTAKEQLSHHEEELQRAVQHLQQLLDDFRLVSLQRDSPASRLPPARACRLLSLPGELLSCVACLAGKDARLLCKQLLAAYPEPPSGTLREPLHGWEVDQLGGVVHFEENEDSQFQLRERVFFACKTPPYRFPTAAIRQLAVKWPGHFTALHLSSIQAPSPFALGLICGALPSLRELVCAWEGSYQNCYRTRNHRAGDLPVATGLTSLTLQCSTMDVMQNDVFGQVLQHPGLMLQMAPALRSLTADLRFRPLQGLPEALARLQQLTHLDVAFDQVIAADLAAEGQALDALAAVAPGLQSLTFRTPATWLDNLGMAIEQMTQLSRLLWTYVSLPGVIPHGDLPGLSRMACLRELVIADAAKCSSGWSLVGESLQGLFDLFDGPISDCQLACLCLPAVRLWLHSDWPEEDLLDPASPLQQLPRVLAAAQQHCRRLTSLQAGCMPTYDRSMWDEDTGAWNLPDVMSIRWLEPVGRMASLQRLALGMDPADMGQLESLAPLQALTSLWLQLWAEDARPMVEGQPVADHLPAHALGMTTSLRELTIVLWRPRATVGYASVDVMVEALLGAVGGLPRLEVLDTCGMVQELASEQPWEALGRPSPPLLRKVVLRVDSGSSPSSPASTGHAVALPVANLLRRLLPAGVLVQCCSVVHDYVLGPTPYSFCVV